VIIIKFHKNVCGKLVRSDLDCSKCSIGHWCNPNGKGENCKLGKGQLISKN